ncbi:SLC13 family permease [Shouchella sp. 1P09AA]|uniref:SLC13 family permease n=1 Tax=unclassified Shouchella TaxID=2893065 RepID=UPI0039A38E87
MRTVIETFWSQMWQSHRSIKRYFYLFAQPLKAVNENRTQKHTAEEGPPQPEGPPAYTKGKWMGLFLGPALFTAILLFFHPDGLSFEAKAALAVTAWVASWWVTEPVPFPVAALLPIILMPLTGALPSATVTSAYGDDIIFLFMGGFFIAVALEKWNLHRRLALIILSVMGTKTKQLIFGFMLATALLSMWISATATVMMMVPMGMALLSAVKQTKTEPSHQEDFQKFEKALLFAIGYAGTVGGMATIVGNPPNIILIAQLRNFFDLDIGFGVWMLFAVPIVILILGASWVYLCYFAFRLKMKQLPGGQEMMVSERKKLGKTSFEEKWVLAIFLFTAFMWITRGFIWNSFLPNLTDGMIAVIAAVFLFLLPAAKMRGRLLNWDDSKNIPWGVLLLFGGGLAVAAGFKETGLSEWIGSNLTMLEGMHLLVIIAVSTTVVLILTEFTSNTATATILLPVMAAVAIALDLHPFALMISCVFAANASFMLPVATPPNAIIFGTGKLKIGDMIKVGFAMNVFSLIVIVLGTMYVMPVVWDIDLHHFDH